MKIKIIRCDNEEDINRQITEQKMVYGGELFSIQKVIEPIGHIWLGYIANPHARYDNVGFTKTYYECVFKVPD